MEAEVETLRDRLTRLVTSEVWGPPAADAEAAAVDSHAPGDENAAASADSRAPGDENAAAVGVVGEARALSVKQPNIPEFDSARKTWPPPLRGDRDAHLLWLVGARGWSLRTRLAQAQAAYIRARGGQAQATSGTIKRLFAHFDGSGQNALKPLLLAMERVPVGRLNFICYALSQAGRRLYRQTFGVEAVESEWERLQRLHQGDTQRKHAGLVMAAAFNAEQYLAGCTTLICPPSPWEGAAPDLYIEWAGGRLYVECERTAHRKALSEATPQRWQRQVAYQGAVAIVADTEKSRRLLLEQIRSCIPAGAPVWATDAEYLNGVFDKLKKGQGLEGQVLPDDGAHGATWFWAVRP